MHASWLNQIEIYFSIVQRKALTPNDFPGLDALPDRLLTFTRQDLDRVLAKIADREPHPPTRRLTTETPGLRSVQTAAVLGHRVSAPSTIGTFLRGFAFGRVRQLDRVLADSLTWAWAAGADAIVDQAIR